ncbi:CHASE2 domain-containing protein [Pseudanabaenaceae cyanobacterium LEGE 13415]|nr:CHASE2 domain-containing protein [Pseudanabaenaceae cyanobacterium LEGE 13415]
MTTIAILSGLSVLQPVEQLAYQTLFWMRGELAWSDRVVVVQIDDRSLDQIGRFPWSRTQYVQLLNVLTQTDATVVAFDLIWSEPSPEDANLAKAIEQHGRVVLACARDSIGVSLEPVPSLKEVATAIGHIEKQIDVDGISRNIRAFAKNIPAFAIATLQTDALVQESVPLPTTNQTLWLNWARSSKRIPSYSFVDVVRGRISQQSFQNKIVLVGVTATGLDELLTPFNRTPPTNGIYLHATLVNNLLQGNLLRTVPNVWIIEVLAALGLSLWLDRLRTSAQLWIGVSFAIAWFLICLIALKFGAIWLPVAAPIVLIVLIVSISLLQERLSLNAVLQNQVQELWQRYYPDLVNRPAADVLVTHKLAQQPVSMQRATQLATLAEQFGRSHAAQAAIARNLSIGLLAADLDGFIWFCNPIASTWLKVQIGTILDSKLVPVWMTRTQWNQELQTIQTSETVPFEVTYLDRWFELRFEPLFYRSQDPRPNGLLLILEDITERKQSAIALQIYADTQAELNERLTERTTQLELVNQELEAFSYAVSHDLRAPLRRVRGFSELLLEENEQQLDQSGKNYLDRIQRSVHRMSDLIEDLLKLSRIIRAEMYLETVDLSQMATSIMQEFQQQSDRAAKITIHPELSCRGDARLLRVALENLLGNAWKYTSQKVITEIEFGQIEPNVFYIRDNGAGFEMRQAKRLFEAFQRLHTQEEFPGNGIGLMTVRRIIDRHQGQIWADGMVDRGATFYFSIVSQVSTQPLQTKL